MVDATHGKRKTMDSRNNRTIQIAPHVEFYLDRARTYAAAFEAGQTDKDIAREATLSPRTVRWYRRLAAVPLECEALIRAHPKVFDSTWAISLARTGPLPPLPILLAKMRQQMVKRQTTKASRRSAVQQGNATSKNLEAKKTLLSLQRRMNADDAKDLATFTRQFLRLLVKCDLLDEAKQRQIDESIWHGTHKGLGKKAP